MKVYTLHMPVDAVPGDPAQLDRAVLVRDGFAFWAFVFTVLWFLYHRLWIAALGVFVALVAFEVLLAVLGVHPLAITAANVLVAILIGLEANSLRRWTLGRRGRPLAGVVMARDDEQAERQAIANWLNRAPAVPPVPESGAGMFAPAERLS